MAKAFPQLRFSPDLDTFDYISVGKTRLVSLLRLSRKENPINFPNVGDVDVLFLIFLIFFAVGSGSRWKFSAVRGVGVRHR